MDAEKIKNIVTELLKGMGIAYESIEENSLPDGTLRFNIKTKQSGLFIGTRGENIAALNHVVKKIIAKSYPKTLGEDTNVGPRIMIDVNNYLEANNRMLKEKALLLAERAKSFKTSVEMDPMTSYERLMVHSYLAPDPHIETTSTGEGKNRRVVIRYKADEQTEEKF